MAGDDAGDRAEDYVENEGARKDDSQPRIGLTRRELLATAAVVSAAGLAACAPFPSSSAKPTPTPFSLNRPIRVGADATVPAALVQTATQRLAGVAGISSAEAATQT